MTDSFPEVGERWRDHGCTKLYEIISVTESPDGLPIVRFIGTKDSAPVRVCDLSLFLEGFVFSIAASWCLEACTVSSLNDSFYWRLVALNNEVARGGRAYATAEEALDAGEYFIEDLRDRPITRIETGQ